MEKELRIRSIKERSRKECFMQNKFKWHNNYGSTHYWFDRWFYTMETWVVFGLTCPPSGSSIPSSCGTCKISKGATPHFIVMLQSLNFECY